MQLVSLVDSDSMAHFHSCILPKWFEYIYDYLLLLFQFLFFIFFCFLNRSAYDKF